jgi:DNA processing protein
MVLDWVSLSLAPGLGLAGFWRLVDHFGSPGRVLAATQTERQKVSGIQPRQVAALRSTEELLQHGKKELELLRHNNCLAINFSDASYPELLREIPDPPPVLYTRGRQELLKSSCLAIVGSRAATAYGKRVCRSLAAEISPFLTIVSGMALGIDTEAHAGALSGGGNTIAVLGTGLDIAYPEQNRRLYEQIGSHGLLVSEYPLGTKPEGFRFPARNRIIAGIGSGVLVVEAARKSGSLITAQIALDNGREVFAVPGQIDSLKSDGTHWLLKQGAKLVQSAQDVIEELCHERETSSVPNSKVGCSPPTMEPDALLLLSCIEAYPRVREQIGIDSGFSPGRLNQLLLMLEIDGLIEILPGDMIRKI